MFQLLDIRAYFFIGLLTACLGLFSFSLMKEPQARTVRHENPFAFAANRQKPQPVSPEKAEPPAPLFPIDSLKLTGEKTIGAEFGVKSVLLNNDKTRLYALNLEGLSVYEYDRETRKFLRKIVFHKTKSKGYDYQEKKEIESYEEKPVEGYLTHNGRYLWISLHNGGCLAVWDLKGKNGSTAVDGKPFKLADEMVLKALDARKKEMFDTNALKLLVVKTGKTPKIIGGTPDGKYLFVTNWHSNNTSVVKIESPNPKDWTKVIDLPNGDIPRGLAVSEDSRYLYVAIMGGLSVQVFDLKTFQKVKTIDVGVGPRHIVLRGDHLYITLNTSDAVVKYNLKTNKIVKRAKTGEQPRTCALSEDGRLLFVTCYKADKLEIYDAETFRKLGAYPSPEAPVGVDVYQDGNRVEAWVCNYTKGTIKIFDFEIMEK